MQTHSCFIGVVVAMPVWSSWWPMRASCDAIMSTPRLTSAPGHLCQKKKFKKQIGGRSVLRAHLETNENRRGRLSCGGFGSLDLVCVQMNTAAGG